VTLNTNVFILDPVNPHDLFSIVLALIAAESGTTVEACRTEDDGKGTLETSCGQGLCAWFRLRYNGDGPLYTAEQQAARTATHDEYCEPGCDGSGHYDPDLFINRPCALKFDLDTTYGYRDAKGGCGDLHARLLEATGVWLDARNVRWEWQNEFTGEIFTGHDGLETLTTKGREAANWMNATVTPVIEAQARSASAR
jgi:hypothetical protein